MSWEEFKDDFGCGYSLIKWIIIVIVLIICGFCGVSSCLEEWRGIF